MAGVIATMKAALERIKSGTYSSAEAALIAAQALDTVRLLMQDHIEPEGNPSPVDRDYMIG